MKMNKIQNSVIPMLSAALLTAAGAMAEEAAVDPAATQIVKKMADCLNRVDQFSVDTQSTLEDLHEFGHRIDLDVSARVVVSRPDKIRAERRGGVIDQCFYYDGKTLTLWNPTEAVYATVPAPATIEGTLDYVRDSLELIIPVSDLVYGNSFALLMQDVTMSVNLGTAVINGISCDHLLFSRPGVDFQLWVADSGKPLPHKLVVTDTSTPEQLSFATVMSNWNLTPGVTDADFAFTPPKGSKPIAFLPLLTTQGTNH